MDKKLISVLIFGIFAISLANILLSMGIVSLLLVNSAGAASQLSGSAPDGMAVSIANDTIPSARTNSMIPIDNASQSNVSANDSMMSMVPLANNTSMTKPATSDLPSGANQPPSGSMPMPPDGSMQMPSGGSMQMPSGGQGLPGSGQASSSVVPSAAAASSNTAATGQYPSTTGQLSGDQLISSLLQQSGSATGGIPSGIVTGATGMASGGMPTATASQGSTSWVFNSSLPFGGN